jgi:hypothetical protein
MFVMAIDGVLRSTTGAPINDGLWLYVALCETGQRVVLVTDGPVADAQRWMRQRNLTAHDEILGAENGIPDEDLRMYQIRTLRANGGHIYCVIESDPGRAIRLMAEGLTTCVFTHPTFSRPDKRFTKAKVTAWNRIVNSLNVRQGIADTDD